MVTLSEFFKIRIKPLVLENQTGFSLAETSESFNEYPLG